MELPSNAQGLHTPEALNIVLRHAERLLRGPTVAALSVITKIWILSLLVLFGGGIVSFLLGFWPSIIYNRH